MIGAVLIALLGGVVLFDLLVTHVRLARSLDRPAKAFPALKRYPSITVVRPVRGLDVGAADNFSAALDNGYPGEVETLFIFDEDSDPAFPVACTAAERHRASGAQGRVEVRIAGPPPAGMTGKLHAMMEGERAARGELIAFGDSDTRPDREVLRALVEELLGTERAGSAFAPVVVEERARCAGDVGYAILINAWYGPAVAYAAASTGDVPFIMGQLMVFKRETLLAIGGVGCAQGQLVDDMHIGRSVARAGYRNVMASHALPIVTGGMTLTGFARLLRRWLLFSRNGLPLEFTRPQWLRGCEFWLAGLGSMLGFSTGRSWAALVPALALIVFGASLATLQRRFGGPPIAPRHLFMLFALPLFAAAVLVSTLLDRQVDWRGRAYALDPEAHLLGSAPTYSTSRPPFTPAP